MTIHKNHSLKDHNTFGIDVKTEFFVELFLEEELAEFLKDDGIPKQNLLIVGGGSNLLFTKDYYGTVLRYLSKGINLIEESGDAVIVKAEAGEEWDDLVKYCVNNKYYGIENLSLIPGLVGAAPIQNIGAYGVELKDVFECLEGFNVRTMEKQIIKKDECNFGYRNSVFKNELKGIFIITSIVLKLSKKKKYNLSYRTLLENFQGKDVDELSIQEISETVRRIRKSKLPDPELLGNAGSFFKNPEINREHLLKLEHEFHDLVFHKVAENTFKIPAGWLIEKCGFKGKRKGNVGCYKDQSLVLVNFGNATGNEIKKFSEEICDQVFKKFAINLTTEVNII